ncbi:hypothetical protein [Nocardia sp. NPDC050710]|uniref:hypothetical protein n=1 Tax=Nocardia sp. NPDC050710 TaxID=3157220 RepID=UPI00340A9634
MGPDDQRDEFAATLEALIADGWIVECDSKADTVRRITERRMHPASPSGSDAVSGAAQ